jgi:hypothetical protein
MAAIGEAHRMHVAARIPHEEITAANRLELVVHGRACGQ